MTLLAASIGGRSVEEVRRRLEAAIQQGADLIELRVDLIEGVGDEDIRRLRECCGRPVILTIRSASEGGHWDGPDDARVSRLIELGPIADYIDVELELWQRSANVRQKVGLALRRAGSDLQEACEKGFSHEQEEACEKGFSHEQESHEQESHEQESREQGGLEAQTALTSSGAAGTEAGRDLILSRHDLHGRPARLHTELLTMVRDPFCRVPKLAWQARSIRDNFEAFELMRSSPKPAIVICMGEAGLLSRVLAKKFGALATFAAAEPESETASGQLTVAEMKGRYRWDVIDPGTRVFGVIGNPVAHSLSPDLHNAAFAALGENAVHLPMKVESSYEALKAFLAEVLARPWLDFRGFSVTIPHKEHALRFLHETGGRVEPLAERIGAVNTLAVEPDGRLFGCNTDGPAAREAIKAAFDRRSEGDAAPAFRGDPNRREGTGAAAQDGILAGMGAAVLGAGGAARAVAAGLVDAGARVTIYNRTEERAAALAAALHCRHLPWEARGETDADLVVNCTSVGLSPASSPWQKGTGSEPSTLAAIKKSLPRGACPLLPRAAAEASPFPAEALLPGMTVFDMVYNPLMTRLLRDAAERGCRTIDGLTMFVRQAQAQLKLWTGREVAIESLRKAVEPCLPNAQ